MVLSPEGEVLREHYEYLGVNYTNNQAEYMALIRALEICSELCPGGVVHVFSDSELLVKQLVGLYRVRSPSLKQLFRDVRRRERAFSKVFYHHVRRELNERADQLANRAIAEGLRGLKGLKSI